MKYNCTTLDRRTEQHLTHCLSVTEREKSLVIVRESPSVTYIGKAAFESNILCTYFLLLKLFTLSFPGQHNSGNLCQNRHHFRRKSAHQRYRAFLVLRPWCTRARSESLPLFLSPPTKLRTLRPTRR